MRLLEAAGTRFDRLVLLSGADCPIYRAAAISRFLGENTDIEFMNFVPMPSPAANKGLDRLQTFVSRGFADRVGRKLPGHKNRNWQMAPGAMNPYGGSAWWAITAPVAQILSPLVAFHGLV